MNIISTQCKDTDMIEKVKKKAGKNYVKPFEQFLFVIKNVFCYVYISNSLLKMFSFMSIFQNVIFSLGDFYV